MRSRLLILIIILASFGCSQPEKFVVQRLQGHWHMYEPYHVSLDISDSTVSVNNYALDYPNEAFPLFDSLKKVKLPVFCGCGSMTQPAISKFSITDNILQYDTAGATVECQMYGQWKFLKSDIATCKRTHLFLLSYGVLKLKKFPGSKVRPVPLDSVSRAYTIFLIVGYPEDPRKFGRYPKIQSDDVFIEFQDISTVVSRNLGITDGHPLNLAIAADASVPKPFIDKTIEAVRKTNVDRIFQVVSSPGDELGYVEVRR